eukprot:1180836-Prorocentrum_minimum.AAC.3
MSLACIIAPGVWTPPPANRSASWGVWTPPPSRPIGFLGGLDPPPQPTKCDLPARPPPPRQSAELLSPDGNNPPATAVGIGSLTCLPYGPPGPYLPLH